MRMALVDVVPSPGTLRTNTRDFRIGRTDTGGSEVTTFAGTSMRFGCGTSHVPSRRSHRSCMCRSADRCQGWCSPGPWTKERARRSPTGPARATRATSADFLSRSLGSHLGSLHGTHQTPVHFAQPESVTTCRRSDVVFTVSAQGTPTRGDSVRVATQRRASDGWTHRIGLCRVGANTAALGLGNVGLDDSGDYDCSIEHLCAQHFESRIAGSSFVRSRPHGPRRSGTPGYGVPDCILNNDDFFYYLSQFAAATWPSPT